MVTDLAIQCFGARELGIYAYDMNTDSQAMLNARLDGILAAVTSEDVVFIQSPVWNSTFFEKNLVNYFTRSLIFGCARFKKSSTLTLT